jgi:hypothetical protein
MTWRPNRLAPCLAPTLAPTFSSVFRSNFAVFHTRGPRGQTFCKRGSPRSENDLQASLSLLTTTPHSEFRTRCPSNPKSEIPIPKSNFHYPHHFPKPSICLFQITPPESQQLLAGQHEEFFSRADIYLPIWQSFADLRHPGSRDQVRVGQLTKRLQRRRVCISLGGVGKDLLSEVDRILISEPPGLSRRFPGQRQWRMEFVSTVAGIAVSPRPQPASGAHGTASCRLRDPAALKRRPGSMKEWSSWEGHPSSASTSRGRLPDVGQAPPDGVCSRLPRPAPR